jgi:endonuclease/exonuclease/phosphatase family metal-dependent hydrolase
VSEQPSEIRALSWNLFHGRDFPPDPALFTWRSRLLRMSERNATHVQVNRDLLPEFGEVIASLDWDVALLQECPPHWREPLAALCRADALQSLTSRNFLHPLRRAAAALNPDLIASNEGGSNLILIRPSRFGAIAEGRELVLTPGTRPERRTLAFARLERGLCVACLHASAGAAFRAEAEREVLAAAGAVREWAGEAPVIFGGDFNLRPRRSEVFATLDERFGLGAPTAPDSIDHLLCRGLETLSAATALEPAVRETRDRSGLLLRLSDHAPVTATFRVAAPSPLPTVARG